MICLRCGYCCKHLWVIIVDDPKKGCVEGNLITHEGHGVACKHLEQEPSGEYTCAIHNEPWYEETPCFRHSQIESRDSFCRMGKYLLESS